jgi:endoribonuclease LACTB2
MSKIIDAVSIVLMCGDEMFAIQRQYFLKAFPGYWAFPGGKVEADDATWAGTHLLTQSLDQRLFGAVVREAQEELGIDLRDEISCGNIGSVDCLGLAVTPDFNPYRFATYFFKINFNKKIAFKVDENEAMFARWMSAGQLLKRYDEGQLLAVPPVIRVIETLGKDPHVKTIPDINFDYDGSRFVPYIESLKGIKQIMPLSHTLPPATRTNAFLIGDQDAVRIILDPSPRDNLEFEKFKNTLNTFGFDKVLITHHHPDHHERAVDLAREYKVPVLLSRDTFERLSKKHPGYFEGVHCEFVKEGDEVTRWLGKSVKVIEVPGHDEGQIALASDDMSWFIAGDLFQGIGTVVIGGEEGDMTRYFKTLEKIIALSPRVVFPSHGIGLGSTSILERTLEHRKLRENQILLFYQQGLSEQEMLEKIYADVDRKLWPFAMENIKKHIQKLRVESKI